MTDDKTDPALAAAEVLRAAEQAFVALPVRHVQDELTLEFVEAEERLDRADEMFADVVPTTERGVMVKLYALIDLMRAAGSSEDSLEVRHLRALLAYEQRKGSLPACIYASDAPWHVC